MSMLRRRLMMQTAKPYIELEYIASTGTQYIDTLYVPKADTYVKTVVVPHRISGISNFQQIFGALESGKGFQITIANAEYWRRDTDDTNNKTMTTVNSSIKRSYEIFADGSGRRTLENGTIATVTFNAEFDNSMTSHLLIFARTNSASTEYASNFGYYKMYSFQIKENNQPVRDFIPVMRKSDGEICLYDKVTQRFFTNQGTGAFGYKISEEYPHKWDYSMGELKNAGYEEFINGIASGTLSESGLKLSANTGDNYIRYLFPIINSSISECEVEFNIESFAASNGFRIQLTNSVTGNQIYVRNGILYFVSETTQLQLKNITAGKDYKIRLWFDKTRGCKVWLDDELIYETASFSTQYCANTAIFQQGGGSTILKSVKYRVIKY